MQSVDDSALLRQFVGSHSDEAFGELVTRHVNLVYSVALRHVGNPHQAEEIAQAVFIILARKAKGLRHDKALSSWLFQTTRLTATNFVRSESRRHRREQEAQMESLSNAPDNEVWRQIAPLLDAAVASLNARDRRAIVLRFYEGRDLREVGAALGATEEAAKKRVARAVEKLQAYFQKRGVDSTAEAIANSIAANSIQIAPAALAKSVIAVAAAKGAAASTSTLTLVKGALKIMAWTKAKTAISLGAGVLLVVSLTWILPKWVREWRESKISFEAEGRLDQFNDGKLTAQYQFAVFISGNRWLIHNVAPPSDAGIKYFEDSFDGTDVYQYIQLSSAPAGVMNSSIGVVTRNNIPSDRSAYATPIWLAYGSSRYFDEIVSNKAKPFFLWGITAFDKEHYPFIKIQWKRSEEPPYVPTNVYCSELNRRYRALQFTNFDGLYVPSEFVVESFSIGDHSMTNSPSFLMHGYLTKISRLDGVQSFRPKLDGRTLTEDQRFHGGGSAQYLNTNQDWFSTNSPQWKALDKMYDPKAGGIVWPRKHPNVSGLVWPN